MPLPQVEVIESILPIAENAALPLSSSRIVEETPYGCPCAAHAPFSKSLPIERHLAEACRNMLNARQAAENLGRHSADRDIKDQVFQIANYAQDLDQEVREVALVLNMPISVNRPYLPVPRPPGDADGLIFPKDIDISQTKRSDIGSFFGSEPSSLVRGSLAGSLEAIAYVSNLSFVSIAFPAHFSSDGTAQESRSFRKESPNEEVAQKKTRRKSVNICSCGFI